MGAPKAHGWRNAAESLPIRLVMGGKGSFTKPDFCESRRRAMDEWRFSAPRFYDFTKPDAEQAHLEFLEDDYFGAIRTGI